MKKSILLVVIISTLNIFAQEINNKPFSTFKFGAFGGINSYKTSDIGGEALVEVKSNLFKNVRLKVDVGYYKVFQPVDYNVKYSYSITAGSPHPDIEYLTLYYAESSTYSKHIYEVFPLSLGFQYSISMKSITPYLTLDGSYNFISPLFERSVVTWEYENSEGISK